MTSIIFDMDDTLVATAGLWRAETQLIESLGAKWTEELSRQYKGMNALDVAATIHRVLRPPVSLAECQRRMRETLRENFRQDPPAPMPGAVECVRRMAAHAKIAVASGSPLEAIELALKRVQVWEHFSVVISSEQVKRGKPSPDVFLAAAEQLGVSPDSCVVFEDSVIGVQAARAAGMACVAVPSGPVHEQNRRAGARVFDSLTEITWTHIETVAKSPTK